MVAPDGCRLRKVIEDNFSEGESAETWIEQTVKRARQGEKQRFPIKLVETITDALPPEYYRVGEEVRSVKRDLGQRKGGAVPAPKPPTDFSDAVTHLSKRDLGQREGGAVPAPKPPTDFSDAVTHLSKRDLGQREGGAVPAPKPPTDFSDAVTHLSNVSKRSPDPVLRTAAKSLQEYLQ